jgi:excisionase family DNA binding protein
MASILDLRSGESRRSERRRALEQLLLRADECAKVLGLGRSKVFMMLSSGELPSVRIGRSVRVPAKALERWVEERCVEAEGQATV